MAWNLQETIEYYRRQGAPEDQSALISLLKEVQQENNGSLPMWAVREIGEECGVRESYLLAVIKRIPRLRIENVHCLELCGGPNCSRRDDLAGFVDRTYGKAPAGFSVRHAGCMRMCGQGPNIRLDGKLYSHVDEKLLRSLLDPLVK